MTPGTYSPAEYEFMLRKYQSDLSVAKKTISTLQSELATARESEKHSIEFIQRDNGLDAKIRNEALESAALWFENPFNGYAMNGSIIAEHIRSLKPQPLNTNIASAPEGSGANSKES